MLEFRFHGRGGQGSVTCAECLAVSAINEGRYAQAFPSFGPERRGAPVLAFSRVSDTPIRNRMQVYHPDIVCVLDPKLIDIVDVTVGLKADSIIVINTKMSADELREKLGITNKIAAVDATHIALSTIGLPITNTTLLGSIVKVTQIVKPAFMEEVLHERFGKIALKNIAAFNKALEETVLA